MNLTIGDTGDTTPAIEALHKDLKKWQKSNWWLTGAMLFLTLVMTVTVAIQVYVQFFSPDSGQVRMTEQVETL